MKKLLFILSLLLFLGTKSSAQEVYSCDTLWTYLDQGPYTDTILLKNLSGGMRYTLDFSAKNVPDCVSLFYGNIARYYCLGGYCDEDAVIGNNFNNCIQGPILWNNTQIPEFIQSLPQDFSLIGPEEGKARIVFDIPDFNICDAKIVITSNPSDLTAWDFYLHCPVPIPGGGGEQSETVVMQYSCHPDSIGSISDTIMMGTCHAITTTITESVVMDTMYYYDVSCNPDDTTTIVFEDYDDCLTSVFVTDYIQLEPSYHYAVSCDPADTMTIYSTDYDLCILDIYITNLVGPIMSQSDIWVDSCSVTALPNDTLWYSASYIGNGCDSIVVIHYHERSYPELNLIQYPECGIDTDVELFPSEGTEPYAIYWSHGSDAMDQSFSNDTWVDISLVDSYGCREDTSIFVDIWELPVVSLGDDIDVTLGDPVDITAVHSPGVVQWNLPSTIAEPDTSISNKLQFVGVHSSDISAMVIDDNGCTMTDELMVSVEADYDLYIPNAFSPNGDGINDTFYPFAGPNVSEIIEFRVYDRWGEEVFRNLDFAPNNPLLGWDGSFRGEYLDAAVFAYWTKIRYIDGQVLLFKGDVTLMRGFL